MALTGWSASRARGAVHSDSQTDTVLRLAVLLEAGIAPEAAWRHLAATGDRVAAAVREATASGVEPSSAIAAQGGAWRELAAAWRVATTVGAPLAATLRVFASAQRDAEEVRDDVRVALAEPAATARLMLWLPAVAVLLGVALGFDTVGVLLTQPIGAGLLLTGALLILTAHRWTRRLIARARPGDVVPGLGEELTAIALSGGVSIDRALVLVAQAEVPPGDTASVLRLSREAGVPAVELLRASAAHARHRARTTGRLTAARLSSQLLIPLGVCTLPAFLCLGVGPMLLSVVTFVPL